MVAAIALRIVEESRPAPIEVHATFAQLARQAYMAAQVDALGLNHLEYLVAQSADPALRTYLEDARHGTDLMRQLHLLIKALVPLEREVRALIEATP